MTKEIEKKIEAAAENDNTKVIEHECFAWSEWNRWDDDNRNDTREGYEKVFKAGATHILNSPRDFGLVPLSEVEGLVKIAKEHECYSTGPVTGDPIQDYVICPACKALQAFETKGEGNG